MICLAGIQLSGVTVNLKVHRIIGGHRRSSLGHLFDAFLIAKSDLLEVETRMQKKDDAAAILMLLMMMTPKKNRYTTAKMPERSMDEQNNNVNVKSRTKSYL
eukprot:scaffold7003_cov106-Skeletonema_dohrnii-CCMP3373.AAC.5